MISAIPATTRNTKNRIFAIDAAPAAIPVKPNSAAIRAMMKNISAYLKHDQDATAASPSGDIGGSDGAL